MSTTETITGGWFPAATGFPGDQQRDLHGGYRAEAGPDSLYAGRGLHWAWTILDSEGAEVDSGRAADEAGAKEAADDWAEDDLLCDALAEGALSAAFAAYGHTPEAAARAVLAVAVTDAFAPGPAG